MKKKESVIQKTGHGTHQDRAEKRFLESKDSFRDLWDIKRSNILVIGVPDGELGEKELEGFSEEVTAEHRLTCRRKQTFRSRKHRKLQKSPKRSRHN